MGVLWIAVLFLSFGQLCLIQATDNKTTESIKLKVTDEIIYEQNIKFDLEWNNFTEVYSYVLQSCIITNLNINNTSVNTANKCSNKIAVRHDQFKAEHNASIINRYLQSATYNISITLCSKKIKNETCTLDTTEVLYCSSDCKLAKNITHYAPPRQPIIHLINMNNCEDNLCEIKLNVTNIQISNTSLYSFQLENEKNISMELLKKLTEMNSTNKICWNNSANISITFSKSKVCNKEIILLLVNDYMGFLNYTTMDLINFTKKVNCQSNYYYLIIIIPIVLIIIGVIAFVKRKSLFRCCKKITLNRHKIVIEPTTLIPLQRRISIEFKDCPSNVLTPAGLQSYLQDNSKNIINNLKTEFKNVGEDTSQTMFGEIFEDKNRYRNVLPYKETRVKLSLLENKVNSHYINASYIKGYNIDRKYIATQGPTVKTLDDFWRMIWQENITIIIMLTNIKENGQTKCEQYWPDKGVKSYEDYTVTSQSEHKYFEYTKREFILAHMHSERNVTQLHFTIWPDKDIPHTPYSLVKFLKAARDYNNIGPILVHCSAGIGRTGTFILCDYIIDMLDETGKADFPQALNTLRKCRKNLVQFKEQYLYSHCVINEYLHTNLLDVNKNKFKENNVSEATIEETLKSIENSDYWLNVLYPALIHYGYNQNKDKHRIDTPQPLNSTGFISLQRYPDNDHESYYIDAVKISIDTGTIINTAQPLPNTLSAFWRLILEKNITVILSLQELDADDKTSIQFWPTTEETLNPVDFITLTLIELSTGGAYDIICIKLEDFNNNVTKYVSILHFKNWKRNSLPEINDFLSYHKIFTEFPQIESVLVTCYDAADASSIFITFLYLLDLLKWNLTIDVNTAISTLKIYRKSFNLDMVKLKFIYDVMQVFLQNLNENFHKNTDVAYENLKIE